MDSSNSAEPGGLDPPSRRNPTRFAALLRAFMPRWFDLAAVLLLAVLGTVAFAITGFFGFPYQPGWMQSAPLHKPAALFLFGCVLYIALQRVIMLHPAGSREESGSHRVIVHPYQRRLALIATLLSITIIVYVDLAPSQTIAFLKWVASIFQFSTVLQVLVVVINMYFLGYLTIEFLFRWGRHFVRIIASWRSKPDRDERIAAFLSVVANDAIAAAILALILAVIFQTQIFGTLFRWFSAVAHTGFAAIGAPPPVTDCALSLAGNCGSLPPHYDPNHLPTITFFDLEFAIYMAAIALFFFALYVLALVVVLQIDHPPGEAILAAIQKLQIRKAIVLAFEAIITPLQRVLWPAFIFAGVLSIAIAAKETQHYIQLLSCQHQAQFGTLPASLQGTSGCTPAWFEVTAKSYAYLGVSLALAAAAAVAVVLAAVVQLYVRGKPAASGRQVAGYWIPAFGLLAWTVLIPFGIFTLPLLLVNAVLSFAVSGTIPLAFVPPGIVSYAALGALLLVIGIWWLRGRKRAEAQG